MTPLCREKLVFRTVDFIFFPFGYPVYSEEHCTGFLSHELRMQEIYTQRKLIKSNRNLLISKNHSEPKKCKYFTHRYYTSITLVSIISRCRPVRSTFSVRETASLGIMGAPRVPPLNPSESIVLSEHYRLYITPYLYFFMIP